MTKRTWFGDDSRHIPRILVEHDDPALAVSDFSLFQAAGFEVATCRGPGALGELCPLTNGEPCELVASAEVVLCCLSPSTGVAEAVRGRHPDLPIVVKLPASCDDAVDPPAPDLPAPDLPAPDLPGPSVKLPTTATVDAQIAAVQRLFLGRVTPST